MYYPEIILIYKPAMRKIREYLAFFRSIPYLCRIIDVIGRMKIFTAREELERYLSNYSSADVGYVPTMGALHRGHISLVERARSECRNVVVTIFVNPTQFNDPTDLSSYPRTPQADIEMLRQAGADAVFMPSVEEVYPEEDTRVFDFGSIDKVMEGATRPGHFNGVAQVVSRFFDMVKPGKAYFGEKDFQQVAVIRAMAGQLGYRIEIVACPTLRETDGLAMSSRNMLLTPEHRKVAPLIYETLSMAAENREGLSPARLQEWVVGRIESEPLLKVIYFSIFDPDTFNMSEDWEGPRHGCIAVWAGKVRLIDNIKLK